MVPSLHRSFAWILSFALSLAASSSPARAQERGDTYKMTGDNSVLQIMPELKQAPAPAWLKPGLRLTWYAAAATVPAGTLGSLVEDSHGNWVDPKTGKHFHTEESQGPAGHGYTVLNVIAVHDDVVAVDIISYGLEGTGDRLCALMNAAITTPPGYCADWWVNPDVLARHLQNINAPGVKSGLVPYEFAGHKYDTLYVSTQTSNGSTTYFSDLKTGVSVHTAAATNAGAAIVKFNGIPTPVGGHTGLTMASFTGMRQLQIPWAGAPLPESVARLRKLSYQGEMATRIPGSPVFRCPFRLDIAITGRGPDFLQGTRTTELNMGQGFPPQVGTSDMVTGPNQLTPLAIPPEHLARLKPGQLLDDDPITREKTIVRSIAPQRGGREMVTLSVSQGPNTYAVDFTYDRQTGLLHAITVSDPTLFTEVSVVLVGKE